METQELTPKQKNLVIELVEINTRAVRVCRYTQKDIIRANQIIAVLFNGSILEGTIRKEMELPLKENASLHQKIFVVEPMTDTVREAMIEESIKAGIAMKFNGNPVGSLWIELLQGKPEAFVQILDRLNISYTLSPKYK